jgi:type II secretory pathway pseudopilin PulG
MITVVVLGVLAAVAIPYFTKESSRAKAGSEVQAMFSEFALREEQFKSDSSTGVYRAVATCPTAPSKSLQSTVSTCQAAGGDWQAIRFMPPTPSVRCSYTVTIGNAGTSPTMPTGTVGPPSAPGVNWYMITALCDMDGDNTRSTYVQASFDTSIQKVNDGE